MHVCKVISMGIRMDAAATEDASTTSFPTLNHDKHYLLANTNTLPQLVTNHQSRFVFHAHGHVCRQWWQHVHGYVHGHAYGHVSGHVYGHMHCTDASYEPSHQDDHSRREGVGVHRVI